MILDKIIPALVAWAFAALDAWLKKRIEAQGWTKVTKENVTTIENELVTILEPVVGKAAQIIAPPLVRKAFAAMMPNDPTTATWG